jgi:hypothetical protein
MSCVANCSRRFDAEFLDSHKRIICRDVTSGGGGKILSD